MFYSFRGSRPAFSRAEEPSCTPTGTQNPASVSQQGAGLVDALKAVLKAVLSNTTLSPSLLMLNDADHFSGTHQLTTNTGTEPAFYSLTHEPGVTTLTRPLADVWFAAEPPYKSAGDSVATAELPEGFGLQPGESRKVSISFTPPVGPDPKTLPVYGGRIHVVGDAGEALSVPYMGEWCFPSACVGWLAHTKQNEGGKTGIKNSLRNT